VDTRFPNSSFVPVFFEAVANAFDADATEILIRRLRRPERAHPARESLERVEASATYSRTPPESPLTQRFITWCNNWTGESATGRRSFRFGGAGGKQTSGSCGSGPNSPWNHNPRVGGSSPSSATTRKAPKANGLGAFVLAAGP
jgi:hypothetical protein